MADRCSELEQQRAALIDTLTHERASSSASATAAAVAAAGLQAEIAELRAQVGTQATRVSFRVIV
jgi:hypothetical protein